MDPTQPTAHSEPAPRRYSSANVEVLATQYSNLHGQVANLETRVTQLDTSLSEKIDRTQTQILAAVGRQIDALVVKFDQQQQSFNAYLNTSRPNVIGWVSAIAAVCAILLAIGGVVGSLAKVPVDQTLILHTQLIAEAATKDELTKALTGITARFNRIDAEVSDKISVREFALFEKLMDERDENYKHDRSKIESEVAEVRTTEVSRSEHQSHWDSQAQTDNRFAAQLTADEASTAAKLAEIDRELHAVSWGDQMKTLFNLYQDLSAKLFQMTSGASAAAPIVVNPIPNSSNGAPRSLGDGMR